MFGEQPDDLRLWVETGERWQAQDLNTATAAKVDQYVAAVEAFAASNALQHRSVDPPQLSVGDVGVPRRELITAAREQAIHDVAAAALIGGDHLGVLGGVQAVNASRMNSESPSVPGTSSPPSPITLSDTVFSQVEPRARLPIPQ